MRKAINEAIKEANATKLATLLDSADKGTVIAVVIGIDVIIYEKANKTWTYARLNNGMLTYSKGNQKPLTVAKQLVIMGKDLATYRTQRSGAHRR